jgi:hypothetical protein
MLLCVTETAQVNREKERRQQSASRKRKPVLENK